MRKKIQVIVLTLSLAFSLAAPAVYAEPAGEPSELQETFSDTENNGNVYYEPETEQPVVTERLAETENLEGTEIPAEAENPEETEMPAQTELPAEIEKTETEIPAEVRDTETELPEEKEETEEELLDGKGYAGMSYASWMQTGGMKFRLRAAGSASRTYGMATLRNSNYEKVQGIDVSELNTITDWNKIKAGGVQAVVIRVGGRYYRAGTIYDDDAFADNVRGAAKAGLKIGVYFFSQAINEKEAIEEADYCAEKMAPFKKNITLPVFMDYEWDTGRGWRLEDRGGTSAQRTKTINAFFDEIVKKGYKPGFYSYDSLLGTQVDGVAIANAASIWIAHWGVEAPGKAYTGVYDCWQYSSEGIVQGITGNVDMDYFYLPKKEEPPAEPPAPGTSENVKGKEGIYIISSAADSEYAITAGSDGNLTLQKKTGGNNQRFIITADSEGRYRITSFLNGKRFDCKGGGKVTGTNVQTYTGNNTIAQTWLLQEASDGAYYIVAYNSGYKAAIDEATFNIQLGTREKIRQQAFLLDKVSSDNVGEGWYTVKCSSSQGYVLDIAAGSFANSANLQIYSNNGTDAQKFYIEKMYDGYYRIMNAKSGRVIDVKGRGTGDNVNIHQYASNETDAQRWIILKNDDGTVSFFSKCGNRALAVAASNFANKSNVIQYTYSGSQGQKFALAKKTTASGAAVAEGRYSIVSSGNKNLAVCVAGAGLKNCDNIQLDTKRNTPWQHFILNYLGNGYYTIYANHSGLAVDVKGGSFSDKANVQQYQSNGTDAQIWKIRKNKDGTFTLLCKKSGKALDVNQGRFAAGINIQQYRDNATKAQKFYFENP